MKTKALALLVAVLALSAPVMADESSPTVGLRIAGGYGFSLNSVENNLKPPVFALSPGIPASAEVLYGPFDLQVSLGVFPVFMTRSSSAIYFKGFQINTTNETDTATYYPVLANIYFSHKIADRVRAVLGMGAGVVPATQISVNYDEGLANTTRSLDAGLALRGVLGAEWSSSEHLTIGFLLQDLHFDQVNLSPVLGWQGTTAEFAQVAPMFYGELRY